MEVQQPGRSRQNSLIEIEISSSEEVDCAMLPPLVASPSPDHVLESHSAARRGSLLKIIETDDES